MENEGKIFGYICYYFGEKQLGVLEQHRAVLRLKPRYIAYDRELIRNRPLHRASHRPGLYRLARGLMPGDLVVVSNISRLGIWPRDLYEALLLLRNHEIRIADMDPDGTAEWRASVEHTLSSMVAWLGHERETIQRSKEARVTGSTYRGVGWQEKTLRGGLFEPFESARHICRNVAQLCESGLSFAEVAAKLNASGIMYVGCTTRQVCPFTPELAEECFLAAKADFPYPAPVTPE